MSRLRPMSKKKRAKWAERHLVILRVIQRDKFCRFREQAKIARDLGIELTSAPDACYGPSDVHEIIPRSAWRDGDLVDENCILLCRVHHGWVDDHPELANLIGLHGFSWERRL